MKKSIFVIVLFLGLILAGCDSLLEELAKENRRPKANAGIDQTVKIGTQVQLDGAGSSDADGDSLSYNWSITAKPDGSTASVSSSAAANPTFTADVAGTYSVQLVVNDGKEDSDADSITVIASVDISNTRPVADAGIDQMVEINTQVQLDGAGSSDADGDSLSYNWSITAKPDGSTASVSSSAVANPTFTADVAGTYSVQLVVNDGKDDSDADTVDITAVSDPALIALIINEVRSTAGYTVEVEFNKQLDEETAQSVDNYTISYWNYELSVLSAALDESKQLVVLTTKESQCQDIEYALRIVNVKDTYGNQIDEYNASAGFIGTTPTGTANWGHEDDYSISGTITYEDGNPAEGIVYHLHHRGPDGYYDEENKDDICLYVATDSAGYFELKGLASQATYDFYYGNAWFDTYVDTPEGYERLTYWPNIPPTDPDHRIDFVLYEIVPNTVLEGYILDDEGLPLELSSEIDWVQGVSLWRGAVLINEDGFDIQIPGETNEEYYYEADTGYYRVTGIAGGEYLCGINMVPQYSSTSGASRESITINLGTTRKKDFTLYEVTGNALLAITMNNPEDSATIGETATFSWNTTDPSKATSYVLEVWSQDKVDIVEDIAIGNGTADVLFIAMPGSANSVTIDRSGESLSITGTDYRLYGIEDPVLSSGNTYYWGIFSYDSDYQELHWQGPISGEPADGLRQIVVE